MGIFKKQAYDLIVAKMSVLHKAQQKNIPILNHEYFTIYNRYIYWMGDLNYRIEFPEYPAQLHKMPDADIPSLWEIDQVFVFLISVNRS